MPVAPSTSTRSSLRTRRAPRNRHPAGHPRDATARGDLVRDGFGEWDAEIGRCDRALGQESVAGEAEAVAEEVDAGSVGCASDAFAAGDVRELRMAGEVAAGADVDVDRIERHGRDVVHGFAERLRPLRSLGRPAELGDHCSPHLVAEAR